MRSILKLIVLIISSGLMIGACAGNESRKSNASMPYHLVSEYYSEAERDSLLVEIVTFIGRKPAQASALSRFEPQFRSYYSNLSKNFILYYYSVNGDRHTFYLSRPARSSDGNRRGVLGTFRKDGEGKIIDFREVLNTIVSDEERIRELGEQLMLSYLTGQRFDEMLKDRSIVEWPDSMLYYDTTVFEWRYVPYDPDQTGFSK